MTGKKLFSNLTKNFEPSRRAKIEAKKVELREEMALYELRQAIGISQEQIAELLKVQQPAIARLERRADIRIRSLAKMIEAMGGTLEINACFPSGQVKLTNYS